MSFSKILFTAAFIVSAAAITPVAQAAELPMFSIFGAANYGLAKKGPSAAQVKGTFGFGGGALAAWEIANNVGIEGGAAFQSQGYKGKFLGNSTDTRYYNSIEFPVGVRFGFANGVSVFGGGYLDVSVEDNVENDYGAVAGVRVIAGPVFIEPRFKFGFNGDFTTGNNKEIQLLVGFSFGGKGK